MKESSLAAAIDKAAQQRATSILVEARNAIKNSLSPYWRPKGAGSELISDDLLKLLLDMASTSDAFDRVKVVPSEKMVNMCRAAIVDDLLNGLPKLKELMLMAESGEGE